MNEEMGKLLGELKKPCHVCPHFRKYAFFSPVETTAEAALDELKRTDDLKGFLQSMILDEELTYDQLCPEDRQDADDNWVIHKRECEECVTNTHC
jgi:hypothetical protein